MSQQTLVDLSRWQWALTAGFHITFPATTVGTSVFLVLCYAAFMRTGKEVYLRMFRFWRRIFAVGFGLGVVAGIVLTFEFGLNWGGFAHNVGPILGVIIGMEVVTAFFLEAGFLGLLIYGDGRISRRVMLFSACMISLGTLLSVTWILAANSWMQTPTGYTVVDGQFLPRDWVQVIFNPSFGWRVLHMLVGVLVSAAWFVTGISAWYLVTRRHLDVGRRGLSIGLGAAAILIPLQMYLGDSIAGDVVARYQLPKLEAFEGNWTSTNTGYNLLIWPDQTAARDDWMLTFSIEIIAQYRSWQRGWGLAFGLGSLVAALCQGAAFGGLVAGVAVRGGASAGGPFSFLHGGYAALTGLSALVLYLFAAAAWVYYNSAGELQEWAAR